MRLRVEVRENTIEESREELSAPSLPPKKQTKKPKQETPPPFWKAVPSSPRYRTSGCFFPGGTLIHPTHAHIHSSGRNQFVNQRLVFSEGFQTKRSSSQWRHIVDLSPVSDSTFRNKKKKNNKSHLQNNKKLKN